MLPTLRASSSFSCQCFSIEEYTNSTQGYVLIALCPFPFPARWNFSEHPGKKFESQAAKSLYLWVLAIRFLMHKFVAMHHRFFRFIQIRIEFCTLLVGAKPEAWLLDSFQGSGIWSVISKPATMPSYLSGTSCWKVMTNEHIWTYPKYCLLA